jgi:hypothetical protein
MASKSNPSPTSGLCCAFCNHQLVTQPEVIPHKYSQGINSEKAGILAYMQDDDVTQLKKTAGGHKRSVSAHKDFKTADQFYGCTGIFCRMKEYMRFDTSSNGGQILCPGCQKHVGQAKMSGIKCGCGFFQVPGYQLWKSRVVVKSK